MKVAFSNRFVRQYGSFQRHSGTLRQTTRFLLSNFRHPSFRAKKYDEAANIQQARVYDQYGFYFQIHGDTYRIPSITSHPK